MRVSAWMMAAALLCAAPAVRAQEAFTYKVDFTIRDSGDAGGKTGRKYSVLVNRDAKSTFKVGNRVPMVTGTSGMGANSQLTYIDVGINIDCTVNEAGTRFAIHGDLDISTAVTSDKATNPTNAPTISQIRINMNSTVPPGKVTTVASFDDPVTSRKFDLDVAIAKI